MTTFLKLITGSTSSAESSTSTEEPNELPHKKFRFYIMLDTTSSMGHELNHLLKEFSKITKDIRAEFEDCEIIFITYKDWDTCYKNVPWKIIDNDDNKIQQLLKIYNKVSLIFLNQDYKKLCKKICEETLFHLQLI